MHAATLNCGRHHGGHTGWCGSKNSRRGLDGDFISQLGLSRVGVMGRVKVRIEFGVGIGLGL